MIVKTFIINILDIILLSGSTEHKKETLDGEDLPALLRRTLMIVWVNVSERFLFCPTQGVLEKAIK